MMNPQLHELLQLAQIINDTTAHDVNVEYAGHINTVYMRAWNQGYEVDTPAESCKANLWMDNGEEQMEVLIDMLLATIATDSYQIKDYSVF